MNAQKKNRPNSSTTKLPNINFAWVLTQALFRNVLARGGQRARCAAFKMCYECYESWVSLPKYDAILCSMRGMTREVAIRELVAKSGYSGPCNQARGLQMCIDCAMTALTASAFTPQILLAGNSGLLGGYSIPNDSRHPKKVRVCKAMQGCVCTLLSTVERWKA